MPRNIDGGRWIDPDEGEEGTIVFIKDPQSGRYYVDLDGKPASDDIYETPQEAEAALRREGWRKAH
jgi:hypothetical protein